MGHGADRFDPAALRKARITNNLTLQALGSRIGVSAQQIHAYEQGRHPKPERLSALAEALGLAPDELTCPGRPTLADLRRHAGYSSQQFADTLNIGRATYSRLEHKGVLPRGWQTLERVAADHLGVSQQELNRIVHPQHLPHDRATDVAELASEFADLACDRTRALRVPRGDPRLKPLAVALGHPQDQVRKVLLAELARVRSYAQQVDMARAQAAWPDTDSADVDLAEFTLTRARNMLPRNLRSGLQLLNHDQWTVLVRAYQLYPSTQTFAEGARSVLELHARGFIESVAPAHGPAGKPATTVVITDEGQQHVEANRDRYRRLYPDIQIATRARLAEGESWRTIIRDREGNAIQIGLAGGGAMMLRRWDAGRRERETFLFSATQWRTLVEEAQQGRLSFDRGVRGRAAKEFRAWEESVDASGFFLRSIFPGPR